MIILGLHNNLWGRCYALSKMRKYRDKKMCVIFENLFAFYTEKYVTIKKNEMVRKREVENMLFQRKQTQEAKKKQLKLTL